MSHIARTIWLAVGGRRRRAAPGAASLLLLSLAAVAPLIAAPADGGACDRPCLQGMLDGYFAALAAHDASKLPVSADLKVTEDTLPAKLRTSALWQAGAVAGYRLDALDPAGGAAAANAVVSSGATRAILFVRLHVKAHRIDQMETLLVRPGEGQRSNPEGLSGTPTLYQSAIAPAQQATRDSLVGAAKAYFQGIADAGTPGYVSPPLAPEARRIENGVTPRVPPPGSPPRPHMSIDEQLRHGFGSDKLYVSEQRFPIVDPEHGIVVAIGLMHVDRPEGVALNPALQGAHSLDSPHLRQVLVEFFKIDGGLIQEIEATMFDLHGADAAHTGWPE